MKKIYRQLLLFSSSIVFMAVAPLVVFFAMGYRMDIEAENYLPVGVLSVETYPPKASLTVNGKSYKETPRYVSDLPPGQVSVSLRKDGYKSWFKELTIRPATVTNLRHVRLFPENLDTKELLGDVVTFSLSPSRRLLAAVTADGKLRVVDEDGVQVVPPVKVFPVPGKLLWSPGSGRVLLTSNRSVSVIDITDSWLRPRPLPALAGVEAVVWDPRVPGRVLALSAAGKLIAYNVATDNSLAIAENVRGFATSSRHIYTIGADGQRVNVLSLQGELLKTLRFPLEEIVDDLLITPGGEVAVWLADSSLAVLDEEKTVIPVTDKALRAGWSPSGQLLYVQTDHTSLHVFNASDKRLTYIPLGQLYLVTRLSRPIRSPQWFAGGHHLVYQVDDEIMITEIDTRDHPVTYQVDSTNLGDSLATVGRHGEAIYYLKRNQAKISLQAAALTVE